MASIKLCSDFPYRDISVPSKFIDEYMPEANGEFVKIYLYLLRALGSSSSDFSISAIADKFEHTEKDVVRALKYWERQKLLSLDYGTDKSIVGIHVTDIYHLDDDFSATQPAGDTQAHVPGRAADPAIAGTSQGSADSFEWIFRTGYLPAWRPKILQYYHPNWSRRRWR